MGTINSRFAAASNFWDKAALSKPNGRLVWHSNSAVNIADIVSGGKTSSVEKKSTTVANSVHDTNLGDLAFTCNPFDPVAYGVWVHSWRNAYKAVSKDLRILKHSRNKVSLAGINDYDRGISNLEGDIYSLRRVANRLLHLRTVNKAAFKYAEEIYD